MHVLVIPAIGLMLTYRWSFRVGSITSIPGIHTTRTTTCGRGRPPFLPRHSLSETNNKKNDGSSSTSGGILLDLQSDSSQYGRGERHLSAVLNEGDVVAYQTGSWLVDGVTVGTTATGSTAPAVAFCRLETMQIVWTHNCEHGVLRGMELVPNQPPQQQHHSGEGFDAISKVGAAKSLELTSNFVEFGPEQLLARFSVKWDDYDEPTSCVPLVDMEEAESWILDTE